MHMCWKIKLCSILFYLWFFVLGELSPGGNQVLIFSMYIKDKKPLFLEENSFGKLGVSSVGIRVCVKLVYCRLLSTNLKLEPHKVYCLNFQFNNNYSKTFKFLFVCLYILFQLLWVGDLWRL